jgi:hypothetical protein
VVRSTGAGNPPRFAVLIRKMPVSLFLLPNVPFGKNVRNDPIVASLALLSRFNHKRPFVNPCALCAFCV